MVNVSSPPSLTPIASSVTNGSVPRRRKRKPAAATNRNALHDNEIRNDDSRPNASVLRPGSDAESMSGVDNIELSATSESSATSANGHSTQGYWSRLKDQRRQEKLRAQETETLAAPLAIRTPPLVVANSTLGVVPTSAESSSSDGSYYTPPMSMSPRSSDSPLSGSSASPILGRDEERRQLAQMAQNGLSPEQRSVAQERNRFVPFGETIPVLGGSSRSRPRFFANKTLISANAAATPLPAPSASSSDSSNTRAEPSSSGAAPKSSLALQEAVAVPVRVLQPVSASERAEGSYTRIFLDQGQTGPASSASLDEPELPRYPPGLGIGIELPPATRVNLGSNSNRGEAEEPITAMKHDESAKGKEREVMSPQSPRILLSPPPPEASDAQLAANMPLPSAHSDLEAHQSWRSEVHRAPRLRSRSAGHAADQDDFSVTRTLSAGSEAAATSANTASEASRSMTIRLPGSVSSATVPISQETSPRTAIPFRAGPDRWRPGLRSDVQALNEARRFGRPTPAFLPYIIGPELARWDALHRNLRRNIIDRNPPASAVPCMVQGCSAILPSPISWLDHIENAHVKCVQCDRIVLNRHSLSQHIRNSPNHFADMAPHVPTAMEAPNVLGRPEPSLEPESEPTIGWDEMDEDLDAEVDLERTDLVPYCPSSPYACSHGSDQYTGDACDLAFDDFTRLQDHLDFAEAHQEPADAGAEPVVSSPRRAGSTTRAVSASTSAQVPLQPVSVPPQVSNRPSAASILTGKKRAQKDEERCPWPIPCAICLEVCENITTTLCGHVGCRRCLQMAVARNLSCPTCRRDAKLSDLHPLYLPGSFEYPPLRK